MPRMFYIWCFFFFLPSNVQMGMPRGTWVKRSACRLQSKRDNLPCMCMEMNPGIPKLRARGCHRKIKAEYVDLVMF